jgi:catechol 2,3-dioxygenase-like lactoylglutathione lyase family enzyme
MVSTFDRIVIAVPALADATAQYRRLLGLEPTLLERDGASRAWFRLPNTTIELVESAGGHSLLQAIVFGAAGAGEYDTPVANPRGLDIRLCDPGRSEAVCTQAPRSGPGSLRVDHLVLRTADAAGCIELFGHRLGIRLALDKTVPEWGGRMLFFRAGKLTLEVIEPLGERPAADYFWGIAYQCADLEQTAVQLESRGVSLSVIRAGRKPGSFVATVKSHCLGIPTLLLQPG